MRYQRGPGRRAALTGQARYDSSVIDAIAITKTTYTIVDFLEWQRQGSLDLRPFYQRRSVWNPRVKSLLMDSLLRGFPLPLIFLHNRLDVRTSKNLRQVVDGQQRLRTILAYIDIDCLGEIEDWDRFSILRSHNREFAGLSFAQLPADVQSKLLQTPLSVNVLPADIDDVTVLTIFQRMNSTGLKLNDQEIRNATFFGEFKESAYQLAYEQYQRWIRWGIFNAQDTAQMKEVELMSDLMGLVLRGVIARTKSSITGLYRTYDNSFDPRPEVEDLIRQAFESMDAVYDNAASKSGLRRFRTTGWFYSVFALITGSDQFTLDGSPRKSMHNPPQPMEPAQVVQVLERAEVALRTNDQDDDLLKVLRGATADRRSREVRLEFLRSLPPA